MIDKCVRIANVLQSGGQMIANAIGTDDWLIRYDQVSPVLSDGIDDLFR